MTYRSRWALGLVFASTAVAGACSSKSNPPTGGTTDDGGSQSMQDAGPPMEMEAAVCPAVSLTAPTDSGAAACFACMATSCMADLTACSTDCMCGPAVQCLEQNSTMNSLNTGYSQCPMAVGALSNGDPALMTLSACATTMCNSQCFGMGGSTSD
jgi:hypothetical protein